ncbi:MAG TPA: HEAT repeat domain-containing protein [Candidatus Limnocylindrales bacterium]|nr:HEAT repeat domain-containing protein [Candidatus Limnocylindrales bacterium]
MKLSPGQAAVLASVLLTATSAGAQFTDHPAVKRYDRVAKGANVEEWKRRLTEETDVKTRLEAVDSLGTKGGEEGIRPLIEATADSDIRIRIKAIDYLGLMKAKEATPALMQLLFLSDTGREEKLRVLTALSRIPDPTTSARLLNYARTVADQELACHAVYALGEIGDASVRDGVEELRRTRPSPDMERLANDALVKIDTKRNAPKFEEPTMLELERKLARQPEKKSR